jgi:23S rRNA-/tRNA-specific pseudouridylate synthase
VHRLDKETDGLMIVAKTEKGLAYFKQLFQQKSEATTINEKELVPLKKYYRATAEITSE